MACEKEFFSPRVQRALLLFKNTGKCLHLVDLTKILLVTYEQAYYSLCTSRTFRVLAMLALKIDAFNRVQKMTRLVIFTKTLDDIAPKKLR